MCGIIAVLLADPSAAVNQEIYDGLTSLQHRGQDAAGMFAISVLSVFVFVCLLGKSKGKNIHRLLLLDSSPSLTHPPTFTSNILLNKQASSPPTNAAACTYTRTMASSATSSSSST